MQVCGDLITLRLLDATFIREDGGDAKNGFVRGEV